MIKKGDIVKIDGQINYKIDHTTFAKYVSEKVVMIMEEPYGTKLTNTEYALVLDFETKMKGTINTKDVVEVMSETDASI